MIIILEFFEYFVYNLFFFIVQYESQVNILLRSEVVEIIALVLFGIEVVIVTLQ